MLKYQRGTQISPNKEYIACLSKDRYIISKFSGNTIGDIILEAKLDDETIQSLDGVYDKFVWSKDSNSIILAECEFKKVIKIIDIKNNKDTNLDVSKIRGTIKEILTSNKDNIIVVEKSSSGEIMHRYSNGERVKAYKAIKNNTTHVTEKRISIFNGRTLYHFEKDSMIEHKIRNSKDMEHFYGFFSSNGENIYIAESSGDKLRHADTRNPMWKCFDCNTGNRIKTKMCFAPDYDTDYRTKSFDGFLFAYLPSGAKGQILKIEEDTLQPIKGAEQINVDPLCNVDGISIDLEGYNLLVEPRNFNEIEKIVRWSDYDYGERFDVSNENLIFKKVSDSNSSVTYDVKDLNGKRINTFKGNSENGILLYCDKDKALRANLDEDSNYIITIESKNTDGKVKKNYYKEIKLDIMLYRGYTDIDAWNDDCEVLGEELVTEEFGRCLIKAIDENNIVLIGSDEDYKRKAYLVNLKKGVTKEICKASEIHSGFGKIGFLMEIEGNKVKVGYLSNEQILDDDLNLEILEFDNNEIDNIPFYIGEDSRRNIFLSEDYVDSSKSKIIEVNKRNNAKIIINEDAIKGIALPLNGGSIVRFENGIKIKNVINSEESCIDFSYLPHGVKVVNNKLIIPDYKNTIIELPEGKGKIRKITNKSTIEI